MVARLAWFFILAISNMDYPDTDTLPSYGQGHAALPPVTQQNSNGVTYLGYTIMVGAENVHDSLTGGHSPIMPCRPVVVDSEGDILVLPSLSDVDSSYHMAKAAAAVAADGAYAYSDQRTDEGDNPMPPRLSDVNLDNQKPIMPCRPVVVDSEGDILVLPSLSDVDSSYHMAKAAAAVAADGAYAYSDQRTDEGDNPMPPRLSDVNLDNQKGKATPAVSNEPNQENWAVGLLPPSLSEVDLECHRARAATYGYSRT